jgi:Ni,Fe-hydrogenase III component G
LGIGDMAYICMGLLHVDEETGKTEQIELALPDNLWEAIMCWLKAKYALFGSVEIGNDDSLFVNHEGKPISMHSALQSVVAKEMWKIMGVRMTPKDQRVVMATKMRDLNLTGNIITMAMSKSV